MLDVILNGKVSLLRSLAVEPDGAAARPGGNDPGRGR
jgi:hypothetical protein